MDAETSEKKCQPVSTDMTNLRGPKYTAGAYWGGTVMPYWVWLVFAIFPLTGFFGIDHLLFRSPSTALAKGFTNIFTLGFWYFYDIVQGLGERDYVQKYGFSKPFGGPAGLAYGYFSGITGNDRPTSSFGFVEVFRFILFCLTVLLPFGISNFIAGDAAGGLLKLAFSFVPFMFLVFGVYESYRLIMTPDDVYQKGATRYPLDEIMRNIDYFGFFHVDSTYPSSALMTPDAYAAAEKRLGQGWLGSVLNLVKATPGGAAVAQGAEALGQGAGSVLEAAGKAVKATSAIVDAAAGVASTAAQVAPMAAAAYSGAPALMATQASKALEQATATKEKVAFSPTQVRMQGGGSESPSSWDGLVMAGIGLLAFGGIASSLFQNAFRENGSTTRVERDNNDTPPRPGIF